MQAYKFYWQTCEFYFVTTELDYFKYKLSMKNKKKKINKKFSATLPTNTEIFFNTIVDVLILYRNSGHSTSNAYELKNEILSGFYRTWEVCYILLLCAQIYLALYILFYNKIS